jgi:hypothetical protein
MLAGLFYILRIEIKLNNMIPQKQIIMGEQTLFTLPKLINQICLLKGENQVCLVYIENKGGNLWL